MAKIGARLGEYRLVRQLGKGGMGEVFEAEHERTGKRVGLKVLHKELAGNQEVLERFHREARSASQIGCAHIVDVMDVQRDAGSGEVFLVMELLVGESLGDRLAREQRLPLPLALDVAAQIADGLDSAHSAGVVHRDLKPDNVFLTPRPGGVFVKVLDFGLAKFALAGGGLTKAGVVLGTPEFMAPEQAESRLDVDHRADVYALGILVYQMVTGLVPFVGDSMGEVLVKQISRAPASPRSILPSLPVAVEQLILRCLAKRREERYATMADLRAALRDPEGDLGWRGPAPAFVAGGRPAPAAVAAPPRSPVASTLSEGTAPPPRRREAGDTSRLTVPRRAVVARPRWLAPTLIVVVAGGVGLAALGLSRGGDARTPSVAGAPPAAAEAPAAAPAAVARRTVRLRVESAPPGARVEDAQGTYLGDTPLEVELPATDGERALTLSLAGHMRSTKHVDAARDAMVSVDLARETPR